MNLVRKNRYKKFLTLTPTIAAITITVLSACSSGDEGTTSITVPPITQTPTNNKTVLTGRLIDSAVENVSYKTQTQSGKTNKEGEFKYLEKEDVTFSIGDIKFDPVRAKSLVTPLDLANTSNVTSQKARNIARFMQSVDADGNPEDGIKIPEELASNASPIDFSVTEKEFENNTGVINQVANSGSLNTELLNLDDTDKHVINSLITSKFDYLLDIVKKGDI